MLVELRTIAMIALMPRIRTMLRSSPAIICPQDCCIFPLPSNSLRTAAKMAKPKHKATPISAIPQ